MSNLSDRVSYLQGLAEGLKLDTEKNEGKLIEKILELLTDITAEMESLREDHDDLSSYVEAVDNDLSDLEDVVLGDDDEESEDDFFSTDDDFFPDEDDETAEEDSLSFQDDTDEDEALDAEDEPLDGEEDEDEEDEDDDILSSFFSFSNELKTMTVFEKMRFDGRTVEPISLEALEGLAEAQKERRRRERLNSMAQNG